MESRKERIPRRCNLPSPCGGHCAGEVCSCVIDDITPCLKLHNEICSDSVETTNCPFKHINPIELDI